MKRIGRRLQNRFKHKGHIFFRTEPESARWLLAHGRVEEAKTIMKKMAKTNKVSIDADALVNEFKDEEIDVIYLTLNG